MSVQLFDLRLPALNSDLQNEQNRLKVNMQTVVIRDLVLGAIAGVCTHGIISAAERYSVVLPALALASAALSCHLFEVRRANKALAERAADLLICKESPPKDVVKYICENTAAWEAACVHKRVKVYLENLWKVFCKMPQIQPEQFPFWDEIGKSVLKKDHFKKALKAKRFDVAEYFLKKGMVKLEEVTLRNVDMPEELKFKWSFTYGSFKHEEIKASLADIRTWKSICDHFDVVKETPLFKEMRAMLLDNAHKREAYRLFFNAIIEKETKLVAFLQECGLQKEDFFNPQVVPDDELKLTRDHFIEITKDLQYKETIDVKRLWGLAFNANYMNEALYQVYLKLSPQTFAREWDLSSAVENGRHAVVEFFFANKKIVVTDELAFSWWKGVGNRETAAVLKDYRVNPNAKSKEGGSLLLTIIDNPIVKKGFTKFEHLNILLSAGATGKKEALARCRELERHDLAKLFEQ